jgi:hypothetical protein
MSRRQAAGGGNSWVDATQDVDSVRASRPQTTVSTTPSAPPTSSASKPPSADSEPKGTEGESPRDNGELRNPGAVAPGNDDVLSQASLLAEKSSLQLIAWMFSFLRPVRRYAIAACTVLVLWIAVDILTTRQMGQAVDQI